VTISLAVFSKSVQKLKRNVVTSVKHKLYRLALKRGINKLEGLSEPQDRIVEHQFLGGLPDADWTQTTQLHRLLLVRRDSNEWQRLAVSAAHVSVDLRHHTGRPGVVHCCCCISAKLRLCQSVCASVVQTSFCSTPLRCCCCCC